MATFEKNRKVAELLRATLAAIERRIRLAVSHLGYLLTPPSDAVGELCTADNHRLVPKPLQQLASIVGLLVLRLQLVSDFRLFLLDKRRHSQRVVFEGGLKVE